MDHSAKPKISFNSHIKCHVQKCPLRILVLKNHNQNISIYNSFLPSSLPYMHFMALKEMKNNL